MSPVRWVVGALGVAIGLWGAWLLLAYSFSTQFGIARWLVAGVVLHDFVLVPLTLVVWFLLRRVLPAVARGPVAGGLVTLGALTLLAIPVLGRFRTVPSNPTLLDRNYTVGWLVVLLVVLLAVGGATAWRVLRRTSGGSGRSTPATAD